MPRLFRRFILMLGFSVCWAGAAQADEVFGPVQFAGKTYTKVADKDGGYNYFWQGAMKAEEACMIEAFELTTVLDRLDWNFRWRRDDRVNYKLKNGDIVWMTHFFDSGQCSINFGTEVVLTALP